MTEDIGILQQLLKELKYIQLEDLQAEHISYLI